ncbi:MAG: nitroreductase/quinone reductase family protein [Actinomycetota bacterium]
MPEQPSRSLMRLQWKLHRLAWDLSGGRLGRRVLGMPVLELETTGHKTGQSRRILISYVETPEGPALAGTNAGADHDPAWIRNLRANPKARVREAGVWRDARARFPEGDDATRVWELFLRHEGYGDYQEMTARPIPLVILEPV